MPDADMVKKLADYVRGLPQAPEGWVMHEPYDNPVLVVLDAALSIRNNYTRAVVPRMKKFAEEYPEINTLSALKKMLDEIGHEAFGEVWNFRAAHRVQMADDLSLWFLDYKVANGIDDDMEAIKHWAKNVDISVKKPVEIKGYGLSAVQHTRIMAGEEAIVVAAYLHVGIVKATGKKLKDPDAALLAEAAAKKLGIKPTHLCWSLHFAFKGEG